MNIDLSTQEDARFPKVTSAFSNPLQILNKTRLQMNHRTPSITKRLPNFNEQQIGPSDSTFAWPREKVVNLHPICQRANQWPNNRTAPQKGVHPVECAPIMRLEVAGTIYDNHKLMKSVKMMMIPALVVLQIEICIISTADSLHS
jgi:hypothetical protein